MAASGGAVTYRAGQKVTGTRTTVDTSLSYSEQQIPVNGTTVRELHFSLGPTTDSTISLDNITNIQVRGGSVPFIDASPAQIACFLSYFGKRSLWQFESPSGTGPVSSHQPAFVLPLHWGMGYSPPPGVQLAISLTKNATLGTTSTPTMQLHEGINNLQASRGYLNMISQSYAIGANVNNFTINITQPGKLLGIIVPTPLNLSLFRLKTQNGLIAEFQGDSTGNNPLIWSQELYQGNPIPTAVSESEANPYTYFSIPAPLQTDVVAGATSVEVSTTASWTDQKWVFVTAYEPQGK